MDFKIKGRTWVGNIYHKFEAICQDVDDFVTKDSVKYVENQVQTVGESVKKIYSNMVHDFLPPMMDNEQTESQAVANKQNDAVGTCNRSTVGIKGKRWHASEKQTSKEEDRIDIINCNSGGVDHQRQFATPTPHADFSEVPETDYSLEEGGDTSIYKSSKRVVEENAAQEEYPMPRYVNSENENSSLNLREEHPLAENLDSPEDENLIGSSEVCNDGDQGSVIRDKFSSRNFVEHVGSKTSQNNKKICRGNDHSEEAETGLSWEQDWFTAMDSYTGAQENATNQEHPMSECALCLKGKAFSELPLYTEEHHRVADELHFLQHENSVALCSSEEDSRSSIWAKLPSAILNHDTGLGVLGVEETICNRGAPSENVGPDSSLEEYGDMAKSDMSLEGNDAKDEPLFVEYTSSPVYKSTTGLSQCSGEENQGIEELTLEEENLSAASLTTTRENPKVTMSGKFPPATSVDDEAPRAFQAEGRKCQIEYPYKDAETDLSMETDGDSTYMSSDLAVEKNHTAEIYEVEERTNSLQHDSACDLPIGLRNLRLESEKLGCSEHENLTESSEILSDGDHKFTNLPDVSPTILVHDAGLKTSQKDETICNSLPDVLSTNPPSSELVTLYICSENKEDETEVTLSRSSMSMEPLNLPEVLLTYYSQKAGKSCSSYNDSIAAVSNFSRFSSEPFSDLSFDNKVINLVPASSSRALSAAWNDSSRTNETVAGVQSSRDKHEKCWQEDDSTVDTADPDMETIDLSDKVKLEESRVFVDNELLYAASSRPRKFRSYKELIHDTFASRKRLIKEYEQLAIWYGDIVSETSLQPKQSLLPSSPPTAPRNSRSSQTCDMCDPEWELL